MTLSPLANGYILGWSVAWPPGPINAEMIRRGLLPKDRGGGFWSAWPIGLGACTGDFIWAFGVSVGAGALLNSVEIRRVLAIVSLALLFFLAVRFAIGAWKIYRARRSVEFQAPKSERRGGFLGALGVGGLHGAGDGGRHGGSRWFSGGGVTFSGPLNRRRHDATEAA